MEAITFVKKCVMEKDPEENGGWRRGQKKRKLTGKETKGSLGSFREKVSRFMQGRYGMDDLGRFTMMVILVLMAASILFQSGILNLCVCAGLIYCYYRAFSRNIAKRYEENQKFLGRKYRILSKGGDKTVRIFKCPTCGQRVRVPKGKGKISIHCPKCNTDFIKRT